MAKPLIQIFSEQEGFCCPYAYITQPKYAKLTNQQLAEKLGVARRTVNDFRSMAKCGGYACRHWPNCLKEKKK